MSEFTEVSRCHHPLSDRQDNPSEIIFSSVATINLVLINKIKSRCYFWLFLRFDHQPRARFLSDQSANRFENDFNWFYGSVNPVYLFFLIKCPSFEFIFISKWPQVTLSDPCKGQTRVRRVSHQRNLKTIKESGPAQSVDLIEFWNVDVICFSLVKR